MDFVQSFFINILNFGGVLIIKQDLPINEQIRADKLQLIDENNQKLGEYSLNDALDFAYSKDLDLVLVSSGNPKVAKIMNYGKYKFEQQKRDKESRKKQKQLEIKEIRLTPNIDTHDFEFKIKNARKFLEDGNKLRITVRFRGRELNYKELGQKVLTDFAEKLSDIAVMEKKPILEGKNMFIILTKK